ARYRNRTIMGIFIFGADFDTRLNPCASPWSAFSTQGFDLNPTVTRFEAHSFILLISFDHSGASAISHSKSNTL
ncbi:MAG: hypothetical protein ABJN75_23015, partial [Hoeflea sp.]|uniref:hypothetical protein n=1 Tax=Hoeflea sp. TaxID=1940281 RepID=UPI003298CFFC